MPSTTKSNKLKRKRGKNFVWHHKKTDSEADPKKPQENPFETHSKSRTAARDLEKRAALLDEYRRLGNNSQIVDHRLAERSSRLTDEDKAKLRFLAEQREQTRK